jgi:hypothetical protein
MASHKFYTQLFDWTVVEMPPNDEGGDYTMIQKNGKNICLFVEIDDAMRSQGVPPHWTTYVSVSSVDESASRARQLGGTVIMEPFDVFDAGRLTMLQGPTGAVLGLWQPGTHIGTQLAFEPGTVCWNELYTKDTKTASAFYKGMFGWTEKQSISGLGTEYTEFQINGESVGGMIEIQDEWGEVPPNWSVYFLVENLDASLKKAQELGGKIGVEPMEIDMGRFAFIEDPHGVYFAVFQMK